MITTALLTEILKASCFMAFALLIFIVLRKDYKELVEKVQRDSEKREGKLQGIINSLLKKFDIIEDLKKDVTEIKEYIEKK